MFYGVENKGNMIAGVIGYDSIRKHLADCVVITQRKLEDMPDEGRRSK